MQKDETGPLREPEKYGFRAFWSKAVGEWLATAPPHFKRGMRPEAPAS